MEYESFGNDKYVNLDMKKVKNKDKENLAMYYTYYSATPVDLSESTFKKPQHTTTIYMMSVG